jgi:hypothetical protein
MPGYNTQNPPYSVAPGDGPLTPALINSGDVLYQAAPFAGQQFVVTGERPSTGTKLRFRGTFSGAPGAFEVDIQEADADSANNYVSVAGMSATQADGNNQFYIDDIDGAVGPFFRPYVKSLTNNVTLALVVVRA